MTTTCPSSTGCSTQKPILFPSLRNRVRSYPIISSNPKPQNFQDPLTLGERYELRVPLWLETSRPPGLCWIFTSLVTGLSPGALTPFWLSSAISDDGIPHAASILSLSPMLWPRKGRISSVRSPNFVQLALSHFLKSHRLFKRRLLFFPRRVCLPERGREEFVWVLEFVSSRGRKGSETKSTSAF